VTDSDTGSSLNPLGHVVLYYAMRTALRLYIQNPKLKKEARRTVHPFKRRGTAEEVSTAHVLYTG